MSELLRIWWCYLFIPFSGCLFLRSRSTKVRKHARQSIFLGTIYLGGLIGLSVLVGLSSLLLPALSIWLIRVQPIFALIVGLGWLWVVIQVSIGREGFWSVRGRRVARGGGSQ